MLKQLELVGFKSFAERTIFEFGSGLTAIVGPNGSGKSNVVDAVRWIMGEQSAKSLRGGGMTDVIFNGSSTRKSLGMAEVSLRMDNTKRYLSIDADEVEITRRVYRDGTSEYLINKQTTRLKDIKEMFLGSGAGVDAYCIIAQGRVEALLQASSQERRFILEEAAGISRFRTKKLETLRKLEQVELNLQRIKDLQDELLRQLQSVRAQASKAEKYRDYSAEMKRLRIALALQEWHTDTQTWQTASQELAHYKKKLEEHSSQASHQEQQLALLEGQLAQSEDSIRRLEALLTDIREKQAKLDGIIHHETKSQSTFDQTLQQLATRELQLRAHETRLKELLGTLKTEHVLMESQCSEHRLQLQAGQEQQATTEKELSGIRLRLQQGKDTLYDRLQQAARSHNDEVSLKSQSESLKQHRRRLHERHSAAQGTLSALDLDLKSLEATENDIVSRMNLIRTTLQGLRDEKSQTAIQLESKTAQWTSIRERRSGLESRVQVLDHLERSREGLGESVRTVLELSAQEEPGVWGTVVGMVADLIMVDHEHAAMVDAVLGEAVQALVVRSAETMHLGILQLPQPVTGRLSYLPISSLKSVQDQVTVPGVESLAQHVGVSHAECIGLVEHLLQHTWIVESLEQARDWSTHYPGHIWVTRQGELLNDQGIVTLGTDQQAHGFLSRKSELREHRAQIVELGAAIHDCETELSSLRTSLSKIQVQEEQAEQALQVQAEEAAALRSQLQQKRVQGKELAEEVRIDQHELHTLDEELARLAYAEAAAGERARLADEAAQQLQRELQDAEARAQVLDLQRQQDHDTVMTVSVALAKMEQSLSAFQERMETAQRELNDKSNELTLMQQERAQLQLNQSASQAALLAAQQTIEQSKLDRSLTEAELAASIQGGQQLRLEVAQHREQSSQIRQVWQQLVDQIHARERQTGELQLKLETLASRLMEEHEVILHELYATYQPPEEALDVASTQQEINELKRKINRLGNVSLDALDELHTLEKRSQDMQTQQADLHAAKSSLDEIIHRINNDSKKLFQETYDAVRVQFQELFRKLFGGGMADIVLENPDDLLESGVDITARPPGKEMRNMSLLSGGEKTMTAVALLLAIFKNKPSPFCILDEVDAALDEANVGRFAAVLREFIHLSQFILITHSKKTMAAADVLYGVTMQEAGISKRVAMRLEEYEPPAPRLAA